MSQRSRGSKQAVGDGRAAPIPCDVVHVRVRDTRRAHVLCDGVSGRCRSNAVSYSLMSWNPVLLTGSPVGVFECGSGCGHSGLV